MNLLSSRRIVTLRGLAGIACYKESEEEGRMYQGVPDDGIMSPVGSLQVGGIQLGEEE